MQYQIWAFAAQTSRFPRPRRRTHEAQAGAAAIGMCVLLGCVPTPQGLSGIWEHDETQVSRQVPHGFPSGSPCVARAPGFRQVSARACPGFPGPSDPSGYGYWCAIRGSTRTRHAVGVRRPASNVQRRRQLQYRRRLRYAGTHRGQQLRKHGSN